MTSRERIEKAVVTIILVVWWLWLPVTGYDAGMADTLAAHVFYPLSHASIWHLTGNLFVLWVLPGSLWLWQSLVVSFLCSWLPVFGFWDIGMTVGFSGVLFAIIGIQWGVHCKIYGTPFSRFLKKVMPFVLIGALFPHVNWCIHLYCVFAGFAYGRWCVRK